MFNEHGFVGIFFILKDAYSFFMFYYYFKGMNYMVISRFLLEEGGFSWFGTRVYRARGFVTENPG